MKILVVGGSGFLGWEVVRVGLAAGHDVVATYYGNPVRGGAVGGGAVGGGAVGGGAPGGGAGAVGVEWRRVDVRSREGTVALGTAVRPDVIVNAAYRQSDWATTAAGGAHVGLAAAAAGARLVHVSSDVVFSGAAPSYDETALPDPITPYGAAKAAAETAIAAMAPDAAIVRTSLIVGPGLVGPGLVGPGVVGEGESQHERFLHRLAADPSRGVLFTDDIRCPVHVTDLASALLELAAHPGVHHVAGPDAVSRHELGVLIGRRDGVPTDHLPTGRRAELGPPAPLDVRLDCTATQAKLTTRLRGARTFLAPRPPGERPHWPGRR
ncbi:sugar nucleotide-binding protein [Cryptosporangium phraense]|uniref:Sugar nucleotide-binding protein n=1 Tax=Cryptosporangium phraense TaxID=2593070 RepID=A0A545AH61_9ACTN|nr:sugar nucleotide-binding protein [Cryptosporangium phraense]TQS40659.1 sugar nucleotide-binding protein [Cryptosporangium phraense]